MNEKHIRITEERMYTRKRKNKFILRQGDTSYKALVEGGIY